MPQPSSSLQQFFIMTPGTGPADALIQKSFPSIDLSPSETNGQYQEIREIFGQLWFATNAQYNQVTGLPPTSPNAWNQVNTALPSEAITFTNAGAILFYTAAATFGAGLTPITLVSSPFTVAGTVTSVTGGTNILSTGGTNPVISTVSSPTFPGLITANGGISTTTLVASSTVSASQFNGSGAGLTAGSVPDAALVTPPVTAVTASGALASSGGTAPNITLTAPLAIANGGTGSITQNFVDLSTTQSSIFGAKTFGSVATFNSGAIASTLESKSSTTTAGYVGPTYTVGGAITAATQHQLSGTSLVAVANLSSSATATITLTGSAVFLSATSYQILCTLNTNGLVVPTGWVASAIQVYGGRTSGSSFTVNCQVPTGSSSTGTVPIDWFVTGT